GMTSLLGPKSLPQAYPPPPFGTPLRKARRRSCGSPGPLTCGDALRTSADEENSAGAVSSPGPSAIASTRERTRGASSPTRSVAGRIAWRPSYPPPQLDEGGTVARPCPQPLSGALSERSDPLDRERRLRERLHRQAEQQERVVIAGPAVEPELVTVRAAVDEHPLAVASGRDRDRLHERAAVGSPVAGRAGVEVAAPQAVRTVVAMCGAGRVLRDVEAAPATSERARTVARTSARRVACS